jgi:hypothetical protein
VGKILLKIKIPIESNHLSLGVKEMQKTIVALYDDTQHAQQTVKDLVDKGISRDQISIMASNSRGDITEMPATGAAEGAGVGAGIGAAMGGIGGLLVGLGALVIPGIGPVLAAGPLAAALGGVAGAGAGAVAGGAAGGILGALTDIGVNDEQAGYYAEGIRRGGTLVTVQTEDNRASQAVDVMNRHDPVDVRTRASEWRTAGWTRFDPASGPYSGTDVRTGSKPGSYYTGSDIDVNPDVTRSPRTDKDYDVEDDRGNFMQSEGGYASSETMHTTGSTMGTPGMDRPVTGMQPRSFDYYESDFRRNFDDSYSSRGYAYNQFQPAYRYGYDLANNEQYRGYDWNRLEPEARTRWTTDHPDNAWEDFKDAIRHAWDQVRNAR